MGWNSTWPDGSKSVKQNETTGKENTNYIKATLNIDHFFNFGTNEDGHHRFVNMIKQASDVSIATGMDGVLYLKEVSASNSRIELFYRNSDKIYQLSPSYKSGSVVLTNVGYENVDSVPAHSYGQVWLYQDSDANSFATGFFKSGGSVVQSYTAASNSSGIAFAKGSDATNLNIKVTGLSGTYLYKIMYWGT